jgi:hypothetical protein
MGGLGERQIFLCSVLCSLLNRKNQVTHVDHERKDHEQVMIGFIPLLGPATLGINQTAKNWYQQSGGEYWFFNIPLEKCEVTQFKLKEGFLMLMWLDVPHFGSAYSALSYRLHMAFCQLSNPLEKNVTYVMNTPPAWFDHHVTKFDNNLKDKYKMTRQQSTQLERAKKMIKKKKK